MQLDKARVVPIIKAALKEDIGKGDITTQALVDTVTSVDAVIIAKEDCVVCGLQIAEWVMAQLDYSVRFKPNCDDGAAVGSGKEIAFVEGHAASMLRAERTMLNFLSLLSGIATTTRAYVERAKPHGAAILDTRKTLPLLRYLEKYAVACGGGKNHRMGLYDQVLIKDNHIGIRAGTSLRALVEAARAKNIRGTTIEIEVANIDEFKDAIAGKPDIIMLDNMTIDEVKACVATRRLAKTKPLLEVSGGITLDTVEAYARTGVDMISVGSLTESVRSIDLSLEIA